MRLCLCLLLLLTKTLLFAQEEQSPRQESQESREAALLARREAKSRELVPYKVSPAEARLLNWEKMRFPQNIFVKGFRGFRPVIGGFPAGSGFAAGAGYVRGVDSERFQLEGSARISTSGYQMLDAHAQFPTRRSGSRWLGYFDVAYRDLKALSFYGLGPESQKDDRIRYRLEDYSFGTGLTYRPSRFFELGASANVLNPEIRPATRSPSIEIFVDRRVNARIGERPDYVWFGSYVLLNFHDQNIRPAGVSFRLESQRYDEVNSARFNFTRIAGEVQAHVPLGHRNRMLAARLRASSASPDEGQLVPFYLMETLGGARTIRGFSEYRFRDTRNLLMSVEYRWEVWTYLDFSFFLDAGTVFPQGTGFDFQDLKAGYGFGIRLATPGGVTFRIDLARSSEGIKLHVSGGPRF